MSTTNILDLNNRIDALEKFAHNVEPIQQQIDELKAWSDSGTKDASGNPIILTDGAAFNAVDLKVSLEPKQSGSGTPSPSNVRPITGYTECVVDDHGENLLEPKLPTLTLNGITVTNYGDGSFRVNGTATANADFRIDQSTFDGTDNLKNYPKSNYCVSGLVNGVALRVMQNLSWITILSFDYQTQSINLTNSWDNCFILLTILKGVTIDATISPMFTRSSTPQKFSPYQKHTTTITFGQSVYGGSVDFKTGKVTVTHASIASYNGETINEPWLSSIDEYVSGTTPTTGAQVVYPLTIPTELTLTPAELELLKGYNYISTNGTTIELTYQPDNLKADILLTVSQLYGSKISIFDAILTGGDTGQVLTKTSDDNYDATWETLPATRTTMRKSEK